MKFARMLVYLAIVCGFLCSLNVLARRNAAEKENSQVEIAIDYEEVQSLAASQGFHTVLPILDRLKSAGVTSLSVTESTIGDFFSTGQARALSSSGNLIIESSDSDIRNLIERRLVNLGLARRLSGGRLETTLSPPQIANVPLGFSQILPNLRRFANEGKFSVVARARNYPESNLATLEEMAAELQKWKIKKVVFAADEVIGWRGGVEDTAIAFRAGGLIFGSIEFGKQKGSEKLEKALFGDFVRVHSISGSEMALLQPDQAVERLVRAARERGVRLLYVRLLNTNGPGALEVNAKYLEQIRAGLERSGLKIGIAEVVGDPKPFKWETVIIAVGIAAGAVLLLNEVLVLGAGGIITLLILCSLALSGMAVFADMGRKVAALSAACVFPVLGLLFSARMSGVSGETGVKQLGWPTRLSLYLSAIILSVAGGVSIAALLSGRLFMTQTDQFAGVKLAHLLPILFVLAMSATGLLGRRLHARSLWLQVTESVRNIWNTPALFGHAIVGVLALVAVLIVLMRSGNDAGVGVSPIELRFRSLLDQILYVRPRTKEIFLGFPALLAAIWLVSKNEIAWARLFFVAAMVGLVSAVNTFCHLHTPIEISFIRVINGIYVGLIIGLVWIVILKALGLGKTRQES